MDRDINELGLSGLAVDALEFGLTCLRLPNSFDLDEIAYEFNSKFTQYTFVHVDAETVLWQSLEKLAKIV